MFINGFVKKAQIAGIVIPSIRKDNNAYLKKLKKPEYIDTLESQIFTPYNPEEDWWTDVGKSKLEFMNETRLKIINKICDEIPIYELSGSTNLKKQLIFLDKLLNNER